MTSGGFDAAITEMMAAIDRQRENLTRLQQSVAHLTGTATAPRHQLAATVDANGDLVELRFLGSAYRKIAAEELASLIVATVRQARQDVRRRLWEEVGDVGPTGADLGALAEGRLDWLAAFDDAFALSPEFVDLLGVSPTEPPARAGSVGSVGSRASAGSAAEAGSAGSAVADGPGVDGPAGLAADAARPRRSG